MLAHAVADTPTVDLAVAGEALLTDGGGGPAARSHSHDGGLGGGGGGERRGGGGTKPIGIAGGGEAATRELG